MQDNGQEMRTGRNNRNDLNNRTDRNNRTDLDYRTDKNKGTDSTIARTGTIFANANATLVGAGDGVTPSSSHSSECQLESPLAREAMYGSRPPLVANVGSSPNGGLLNEKALP